MTPYVIERAHPTTPSYWEGTTFTIDVDRAIQFVRAQDATLFCRLHQFDRDWNGARVVSLPQ